MSRIPGTFTKIRIWEGEIPGSHEPGWVEPPLVQFEVPESIRAIQPPGVEQLHCFEFGECSVMLSRETGRWHVSISHTDRHPSWDEIKTVRYRLGGPSITMAMVLPPPDAYVNVPAQDHVFQLWQLLEEADGW